MKVNLSISIEEAGLLLTCLSYLTSNMAASAALLQWHFVPGKDLKLTLGERCRLELLSDYLSTARHEAIEKHPFNPFIKTF